MTGPKRFTPHIVANADQGSLAAEMVEIDDGGFVYWSEYDALAEAFTIYMETGMDEPQQVADALRPYIGDDADFIAGLLVERMEKAPPPKPKRRRKR